MPNKLVKDVKDIALRAAGRDWQNLLGLRDLTTRELDNAAEMVADGKTYREAKKAIRAMRRGK